MNHSCKCDNCGETADDQCPIAHPPDEFGCGWELCNECIEKVKKQKIPGCPNCGNVNWPLLRLDQKAGYSKGSGRDLAADELVEEGWRHHSEER